MFDLVQSVKKNGVLSPGIVRPRAGGGYEIISGHRRKRASELAGRKTMPVFCRNYTDNEAVIVMVDANLQREEILPSEKAYAYKMKYEAMKKTRKKGEGKTLRSLGEKNGESQKTVQNYIWLTRLIPEIMDMVDRKEVGIRQAINLSFIDSEGQKKIGEVLMEPGVKISFSASKKLRNLSVEELSKEVVQNTLKLEQCNKESGRGQEKQIILSMEEIAEFFPQSTSVKMVKEEIFSILRREKYGNGCQLSERSSI
jgi:ParB family chromosome partitioning protein